MKPKSWVIYKDKESKVDAVEDDLSTTTEKLKEKGNIILGHSYFIRKNDAINWVEHDHYPNGKYIEKK